MNELIVLSHSWASYIDVWETTTWFLTSRMRTFNNILNPSLYFYLKVNLSHFSKMWFSHLSNRDDNTCLSQISVFQPCLRNAEAWHFISLLQTDGKWKLSQWEATLAVSVHWQRVHLLWDLGAELLSSKRKRKYLANKSSTREDRLQSASPDMSGLLGG